MAYKIVIDGIIGGREIDGRFIRNELEKAAGKDVYVEIASPGGFVFDGIEIFNLFKNYSGNVHFHIMGLAASMASYIPLAGNKITAEENAVFMIHNVWAGVVGDYKELEKEIKVLKGLTNLLAKAYAQKTGKPISEIREMMDNETFLFGNEIIENGFIDELIPATKKVDSKEDSLLFAKMQIEDCFAKMKKEENKEDLQKAAALINIRDYQNNIPEPNKEIEENAVLNNKPAESGKKEGSKKMNLEQLKAEHPELFQQAKQAGFDEAMEMVNSHLEWFDAAPEMAVEAIKKGEKFTNVHLSKYSKASMTKKEVNDSIDENVEDVSTETNLDDESQKEAELLNQTLALSKKGGK